MMQKRGSTPVITGLYYLVRGFIRDIAQGEPLNKPLQA